MAVQSEIFSTEYGVRSFISTKHIATKQHMSVWLQRRSDNIWVQLSISNYELINNSAVLTQAPNSTTYSQVEIRVADTPDELGSSQSEISIVAGLYDEIVALNGIKNDITTVAGISGDVTTVSSNILDINSVVTNIVPNLAEILQADTNATIATTKATEASASATSALSSKNASALSETNAKTSETNAALSEANALAYKNSASDSATAATTQAGIATTKAGEALASATAAHNAQLAAEAVLDSFDDKYLGAKATAPTVDNDGNPIVTGALYFKTTAPKGIYVYDAELSIWSIFSYIPTSHGTLSGRSDADSHTMDAITGLIEALLAKAPLLSPALTGTPTAPTQVSTDNSTTIATTAFVKSLLVTASQTVSGIIKIATNAEVQDGTNTTKAITPAGLAASVLGFGQTLQNVTASRTIGTTYTNSTGKPIYLTFTATNTAAGCGQKLIINSADILFSAQPNAGLYHSMSCIIPNGATYSIYNTLNSPTTYKWFELR